MKKTLPVIIACTALVLTSVSGLAQGQSAPERAAALKASLAVSQAVLKQYEWIETTVVSVKGEEKSRQLNRCYYGADGGVQKVPLTTPPPAAKKRGLRGKIAEAKKEELTDYMKNAVALVKAYVPPNPQLIQVAKDNGKVSMDIVQPGKRARLHFRDYLKPGDTLSVDLDLTSNHMLGLTVKSYLETRDDAVNLEARLATLADGTTYPDLITLDAPAKKIKVQVDNSGYRKTGK